MANNIMAGEQSHKLEGQIITVPGANKAIGRGMLTTQETTKRKQPATSGANRQSEEKNNVGRAGFEKVDVAMFLRVLVCFFGWLVG